LSSSSRKDIDIVRGLADRIMELATSDEYERRRQRWRDVNALRRPDRAPVWCRPADAGRKYCRKIICNAGLGGDVKLDMVGVQDRYGESGAPWELMKVFGLTAEHIADKARKLLEL